MPLHKKWTALLLVALSRTPMSVLGLTTSPSSSTAQNTYRQISWQELGRRTPSVLGLTSPSSCSSSSTAQNTDKQISWQELGGMLLGLRNSGVPQEVLLRTRLSGINLSRTRIGPSGVPNAGRGLFATMDCPKGELLTCYPGDVLLHQPSGRLTGVPEELERDDERLRYLLKRYCVGVMDDNSVGVMGLPTLDKDVAYAGHFANDGARPPEGESDIEGYVAESQGLVNAEHVPLEHLHMVTIATRDITKGEEIFVFYGPHYWL